LGTLLPMIGIVQVGIQQMADRYAYFPMLGLYAAVAWLVPALIEPATARARRLPLIATGVVGVYAVIAFLQVGFWRDGVTLMQHTLATTPDNSYARFLLGDALYENNQIDQALAEYQHAVRLAPNDPESHFRLGWVYQGLKDYDRAAEQYRASLALDDKITTTHNRLGWILWAQHQEVEAEQEFNQALQLDAKNIEANANLAGLSRAQGDFKRSIDYCHRALELDHSLLNYQRLIAFNLRDLGRLDEAITQLRSVLAASPSDAEARSELAHIEFVRGDRPDLVGRAN
jgi:tetratricopeptide (TPR) repeat protein